MGSANKVIKNTGILYAKMAITVFLSLYTTRLVLLSLGVQDFGIFNLVGGAIAMLTFLNNAMTNATQRFMSYSAGAGDLLRQKKIFNVSSVLHLVIAILIVILLEVVGYFLFKNVFRIPADRIDSAKFVFQFMAVSTFFTIVSVPYDAVINAHENMLLYSLLGIVESIIKLLIALYLMSSPYDKLVVYGLCAAILSILLLIVRRIYCSFRYEECKIDFKQYFDKTIFHELKAFAAWSFLGASSSMISNYGQGIVMNSFFGPVVNTAQGVASQVSGQLGVFAGTMSKALNPVIDKSEGAGNRSGMLRASLMGSKISFFLLLIFYVPMLIEMPYVFDLWLKTVPPFVILFCRLLLIRNLIEQLFLTLHSSITAVGNIKRYQICLSMLNILPLIICYGLFSYDYPAETLYVVFLLYSCCSGILILFFAEKYCGLSVAFFLKEVVLRCVAILVITFILAFIPWLLLSESFLRLLLVGISSTFSFLVATWFIGFPKDEKMYIQSLLSGLRRKFFKRQIA
jgi:O-antigen/teichoic acid export membrane protein